MKLEERYIDCLKTNVTFYIGQNAQDNHNIIDEADPEDIWFHIHETSSCHVIAIVHNMSITKKQLSKIIKQGALLCKQYSKQKSHRNTNIIYSKLKNVTKTHTVGSVNVADYKIVTI